MGNYRFRFSDMIPSAWFYKLKDMSHRGNKNPHSTGSDLGVPSKAAAAAATTPKPLPPAETHLLPYRASCYYPNRTEAERFSFSPTHSKAVDTHFPVEPPTQPKKKGRKKPLRSPTKPKLVASSGSAGCSCRAWKTESIPEFPSAASLEAPPYPLDCYVDVKDLEFRKINYSDDEEDGFEYNNLASWQHSCSCRFRSSARDIIIDTDTNNSITGKLELVDEFDSVSELKLPPIITKPGMKEPEAAESEDNDVDDKVGMCRNVSLGKGHNKAPVKKSSPGIHRLRMRANSPRLASKKVQAHRSRRYTVSTTTSATAAKQRKGLSESFAVVKSSSDPQRDFRDSMLEMIVENNIRASKDLEELLACYLSLNSDEYHDVIVKAFQQIWFDLCRNIKL